MRSYRLTTGFLLKSLLIRVLVLGLTLSTAGLIFAAPGDLDFTFGNGGKVITQFNLSSRAFAMTILPNGKIIAAGVTGNESAGYKIIVARYNQNGTIDGSFGSGGRVTTQIGPNSPSGTGATAVAIQSDGKIVVAGYNRNGINSDFALARYHPNGSLDTSFGILGVMSTQIGTALNAGAETVSIQSDGKIIAAGSCRNTTKDMALVRYNADGTLDTSFGANGKVITSNAGDSFVKKIRIQTDGKIVAAGELQRIPFNLDFIIVRYDSNGSLDSTFGVGGKVITDINGSDIASDIAIQTDGKFVVAGGIAGHFALARYHTSGSLDTSFGTNGTVRTIIRTSSSAAAVALQADGKIIAAGEVLNNSDTDFGVVRYRADGSIDTSFGTGGIVLTSIAEFDFAQAVGIHSDGRIVAAGYHLSSSIGTNFGLARYLGDVVNRTRFDFDGDGKADQAVYRNGIWYLLQSQNGFAATQFGISTDKITPADFDGDGETDISVFRDGYWHLLLSQRGYQGIPFGIAGDIPVPADYDGDGNADLAVYRNGIWHVMQTALGYTYFQFGISTDKPVPADYDADGKTDAAVYRDGVWYVLRSTAGITAVQFGIASDQPVVGDYDGDAKADQAVFRAGVWYILGSTEGYFATQFGIASDVPVAADYDGDGKTDIAVFREGAWHILSSQQGYATIQFGTTTDRPIPAAFVP